MHSDVIEHGWDWGWSFFPEIPLLLPLSSLYQTPKVSLKLCTFVFLRICHHENIQQLWSPLNHLDTGAWHTGQHLYSLPRLESGHSWPQPTRWHKHIQIYSRQPICPLYTSVGKLLPDSGTSSQSNIPHPSGFFMNCMWEILVLPKVRSGCSLLKSQ